MKDILLNNTIVERVNSLKFFKEKKIVTGQIFVIEDPIYYYFLFIIIIIVKRDKMIKKE